MKNLKIKLTEMCFNIRLIQIKNYEKNVIDAEELLKFYEENSYEKVVHFS